ncbi:MAG: hypothetical protein Kow00127_03510 [Bacteroidales bacterium]
MKICSNCGVELDPAMKECPLCHELPVEAAESSSSDKTPPVKQQKASSDTTQTAEPDQIKNRKLFWELTVLIFLSVSVITLVIDLLTTGNVGWSKYTVTVSLVMIILSSLFSFRRHKPVNLTVGTFITFAGLILLLDYFGHRAGWGWKLGMPLLLVFYLFLICTIQLIRRISEKGINIIALTMVTGSLLSLAVEAILDYYFHHSVSIGWSLYVLGSAVPVAAVLLFVHYRMKKGRELKRLFHL